MSRIGKISVIPKTYSDSKSFEFALQKSGFNRAPGTGIMLFPHLEADGRCRTALDENNVFIRKIEDPELKKAKIAATQKLRKDLEEKTQVDLGGFSKYYRFGYTERRDGQVIRLKTVEPYKLRDEDNIFDLSDSWTAVTYYWLSVHPRIASSLEAYNAGQYPPDTFFYVKDEEKEAELIYMKKKTANDAIIKFNGFSPEKKKKISRLCDLPAYDDTREEMVYNMMDEFLKAREIPNGAFKGSDPIRIFSMYADLDDNSIYTKDLIEQAFRSNIYRVNKGKVYEGNQEVFKSKEELLESLLEEKNQGDLLDLEKKLKLKKLASV